MNRLYCLIVLLIMSNLAQAQNYPTVTSIGDYVEKYTNHNNGFEIGVANIFNARRSWILTRHSSTTASLGKYYSSLHLQPDIGDKSQYRGVAIGYTAGTAIPVSTHLAVNGKVGIGFLSPLYDLHVKGTIAADGFFYVKSDDGNGGGTIETTNESNALNGVKIYANRGSGKIVFATNSTGEREKMRITNNGNVGIGTPTPTSKLDVNGNIRAKEIKIEASNWPDYVFEEGYQQMRLEEVETFISEHGHLPGMKSAEEYQADGVNLMELNQKLVEKIEEITVHLIEKEKVIQFMEKQIGELKANEARITALESRLEALTK